MPDLAKGSPWEAYCRWCIDHGKRETWIGLSYWQPQDKLQYLFIWQTYGG